MKRTHVIVLVCMALLAGCEKKASETKASDEIDFGTIKDSTYRNKYFGFSIEIPSGWSVQDQEAQKRIVDVGTEVVAGDNKTLKAVVKASELRTVNLLAVSKHPMGSAVETNPTIMCVAERVRHMPGITRGKDYLFHAKRLLQTSQLEVSFYKETYTEQVGGVSFDVMPLKMSIAGLIVKQKMYAAIMKGYALTFVVAYATDEEEKVLADVMNTLVFE